MDNLAGITAFVQAAETCSFVDAGRLMGVSASAIGKSIARLEERLDVRLFHRNTRSMKLTEEGTLFLQRCQRILGEVDAAERELSEVRAAPRGKLKVSLPAIGSLLHPAIGAFVRAYPEVALDIDFTDRKVDLIEEGFDAVVRIGQTDDSRLMSRQLGEFHRRLVAAPSYLKRAGVPRKPDDLRRHTCLLYKFPSTGKIEPWAVEGWDSVGTGLHAPVTCNAIDTLTYLARHGEGVACLPDFEVAKALASKELVLVLPKHVYQPRPLTILWPSSKQLAPKLRAFIDTLSDALSKARAVSA